MIFLSMLVAILWLRVLRWNGGAEYLLDSWQRLLARHLSGGLLLLVAVLLPVMLLVLCLWQLAVNLPPVAGLLIGIPVLLLSLGKADLPEVIDHYGEAARRGDNIAAREWVDTRGAVPLQGETATDNSGWDELHQQALDVIGYTALRRYFAVLFWFLLAGPAGALFYRLLTGYCCITPAARLAHPLAARLGSWLEWPVSRVLALSWALVGQFDAGMKLVRQQALAQLPVAVFLGRSLKAASAAVGQEEAPASLQTLEQTPQLVVRALWLWLCASALITLSW